MKRKSVSNTCPNNNNNNSTSKSQSKKKRSIFINNHSTTPNEPTDEHSTKKIETFFQVNNTPIHKPTPTSFTNTSSPSSQNQSKSILAYIKPIN